VGKESRPSPVLQGQRQHGSRRGPIVLRKPGNAGGGRGPCFWCAGSESVARRICDGKMLHLIKMWLKVPVEETDGRGRKVLTGGARSSQGTPQGGVISPLLANIYIHRLLRVRAWKKFDLESRLGARIINYADDFVIVCRTKAGAHDAFAWLQRITTGLGLRLNETKTCIRHARQESFDFLGYTLGRMVSRRTGRSYLGAAPSKKAVGRARQHIAEVLRPGNQAPAPKVVAQVNRCLIGWANYFSLGALSRAYRAVHSYTEDLLRGFLVRRHKVSTRGIRRFDKRYLRQTLGLVCLSERRRVRASHALG
jgi:RNA-directed DNA polymerase